MEDMQKRIDRDDLAQEKLDGIKVCLMTTRPPPGSSNGVFLWANFAVPMYRQCAILLPIERRSWAAQTPVEYHGRRIATRLAYIYIYIYIYSVYRARIQAKYWGASACMSSAVPINDASHLTSAARKQNKHEKKQDKPTNVPGSGMQQLISLSPSNPGSIHRRRGGRG